MDKNLSHNLLYLSQTDGKVLGQTNRQRELVDRRGALIAEIEDRRVRLSECEEAHKQGTLRQVMEEHRLRDEHERIVERRKQLSTLGGAKVAKLLERELDIASRTVKVMEEKAVKAVEEVDSLETELTRQREALESLEQESESQGGETEAELHTISEELKQCQEERDKVFALLDDRLQRLYERVRKRYPGAAVAIACEGACQSCYRALPSQTYNQIMAGNMLIQCPGCSRLMVYVEDKEES